MGVERSMVPEVAKPSILSQTCESTWVDSGGGNMWVLDYVLEKRRGKNLMYQDHDMALITVGIASRDLQVCQTFASGLPLTTVSPCPNSGCDTKLDFFLYNRCVK